MEKIIISIVIHFSGLVLMILGDDKATKIWGILMWILSLVSLIILFFK